MLSISNLDTIFTNARRHKGWLKKDITEQQIN
jgi:hypothetical protein